MQQRLAPAYGRFGISSGFQQKLLANFLLCHRFSLHELLQFLQVFVCIKGYALTFTAISTGTSGLLVIPFQTLWNIVVNHKPYIRLVDSHTESDSCYNNVHFFHQEIILILGPGQRIHSSMIRTRIDTVCLQDFSKFLHFFPAKAIDNARFLRIVFDKLDNIPVNISGLRTYLIIKVRTVERRFEDLSIHHSQIFLDIMLHLRCRRCGKRNQRSFTYFIDNRANPPVFRSKVMAPFRNTVSFIHCIERNLYRTQKLYVFFFRQRLRRYI